MDSAWTTEIKCDGSPYSANYFEQDNVVETIISEDCSDGPAVEFLDAQTGTSLGTIQTTGQVMQSRYADSEGLLLMCTNEDSLYAVDARSATIQWQTHAPRIGSVTEKRVYSYADTTIWAYDLATGTHQWEHVLPDPQSGLIRTADDTVYVQFGERDSKGLVALDPATGEENWSYRPGDAPRFNINNRGLYAEFSGNERLYQIVRIDDLTGAEKWSFTCAEAPDTVKCGQSSLFVREYTNGTVVAIDRTTGTLNWRSEEYYRCQNLWLGESELYMDGEGSYSDDFENIFHRVDLQSGRTKWKAEINDEVSVWVTDESSDDLYIGTNDYHDGAGRVYRVNRRTGRVKWQSTQLNGPVRDIHSDADPVLVSTGGEPETVYALDNKNGKPLWSLADEGSPHLDLVTSERFVISLGAGLLTTSNETHIMSRSDKKTEMKFDGDLHIPGGGALFVFENGEASGYPVATDPEAFQDKTEQTNQNPTEIYTPESEASEGPAGSGDTKMYEASPADSGQKSAGDSPTVAFCPSCGADLSEFGEMQFCPSCGSGLPD